MAAYTCALRYLIQYIVRSIKILSWQGIKQGNVFKLGIKKWYLAKRKKSYFFTYYLQHGNSTGAEKWLHTYQQCEIIDICEVIWIFL